MTEVDGQLSRKAKSRFFCRGFLDGRNSSTFAGTPDIASVLLTFLAALSANTTAGTADITTAFLQAPETDGDIYVTIPNDWPDVRTATKPAKLNNVQWKQLQEWLGRYTVGTTTKLQKSMYGLKNAPKLFTQHLKKILAEEGYKEVGECFYLKKKGNYVVAMTTYVDDLLCSDADELKRVSKRLQMGDVEPFINDTTHRFIGIDIEVADTGLGRVMDISQRQYVADLDYDVRKRVIDKSDLDKIDEIEKDEDWLRYCQHLSGKVMWVLKTQAHVNFVARKLASGTACHPLAYVSNLLQCLLMYVKENPYVITLQAVPFGKKAYLHLWTDAAFDLREHSAELGWICQLWTSEDTPPPQVNILKWGSKKAKRKVASSSSAELFGVQHGIKAVWKVVNLLTPLYGALGDMLQVVLHLDSRPLIYKIESENEKAEPHLQGVLTYVCQEVSMLKAKVRWCATDEMRADMLTKSLIRREDFEKPEGSKPVTCTRRGPDDFTTG